LEGKILELRVRFATNQYRIFFFFFSEDTIVLLHAFLKKTPQVPAHKIERAERNMDDFLARAGGK
jgi:phage-related protein